MTVTPSSTTSIPVAPPTAGALPVMDARKTLLIGLGSTGAMACNQILERLNWTYDSLENVPWVKCLTLETAGVPAEKMVHTQGQFQRLTISQDEYSGLVANPQLYKDKLDFPAWNIHDLIGTADAITAGANNTRILGRLALLFPSNFAQVQANLGSLLQSLNALTAQEASESIERGLGHKTQVVIPSEINVYVIGTLCGGTASGSFIDLGYMLKALPGISNYNLATTGIFLLPSGMSDHDVHISNAMAGLVELNHFSHDRSRYKAQYPNAPGTPWQTTAEGERPYRNLYLVQPRGASTQDYARLVTMTADYVYSDVIGSSAIVRDGARTNIALFFLQKDYWGATQKYYTFGMSVIEFPYIKVLKGCTLKLAGRGFQMLLGSEPLTENAIKTETEKIPFLNRRHLLDALLKSNGESISTLVDNALSSVHDQAIQTDAAMDTIISQLDATFDGTTPIPLPRLQVRAVPIAVEENERGAARTLENNIQEVVGAFLTGSDPRGIESLISFLKALEGVLTPKPGRAGEAPALELRAEMDAARDRARECRHDFWLKLVGQTGPAVRRYIGEFTESAKEYYSQRLRDAAGPACDRMYANALEMVRTVRRRVGDEHLGLRAEVQQIVVGMGQLYQKSDVAYNSQSDPWSRTINGTELFTPGQTIEQEYWSCLEETAEARNLTADKAGVERIAALAAVKLYFSSALMGLTISTNRTGRFDPETQKQPKEYSDDELLEMAFPARLAFKPLRERSIIDRLLGRSDINTILKGADNAASAFLEQQQSHTRYYQNPNKTWGYVFYNQNHPQAQEFLRQLKIAGIDSPRTVAKSIADPHQVLILREEGAFSLGTVTPLRDEVPTHWWSTYRNPTGVSSLHSRGDIKEWITWARKDEEDRVRVRNTFLVAVSLGVIQFKSATQYAFEYPPTSPADSGFISFKDDLDESARILKSSDIEGMVELKIDQWRRLEGATDMVGKLVQFIKDSDNHFCEGERRLSPQDVQVYLLDYIFGDQELSQIYSTVFYKNVVELSYRREDDEGKPAYFCPKCNMKLGFSADALYVYKIVAGRQIRARECAYCQIAIP